MSDRTFAFSTHELLSASDVSLRQRASKWLSEAISSRHSNLNFAHHFVIYWLFQNGANKNQHQKSHQREPNQTNSGFFLFCFVLFCILFFVFCFVCLLFFFSKLVRQKTSIGWAKYMYECEWDMCWRSFCNFSLVTNKCEK